MKSTLSFATRLFFSLLPGLAVASAFASSYANADNYAALDRLALFIFPAVSVAFLAYFLLQWSEAKINELARERAGYLRLLGAWLLGSVVAYLATGFLENFYRDPLQIFWLSLFAQIGFGALADEVLDRAGAILRRRPLDFGIAAALFFALACFTFGIFSMNSRFPVLFAPETFLLGNKSAILFLLADVFSLPLLAWTLSRMARTADQPAVNQFIRFFRKRLPGLLLASVFFYLYLLIGSVLNFEKFDVDDIFFDADGFIWRYRLITEHWQDFYWRSVHPLALLLLRPATHFIAFFLGGDLHFSAILLTALTGAACVFLTWQFMRDALSNEPAALIMAALLGLSASHLFFGSLIETYIFLAAAALATFVLMQRGNFSPPLLISAGVFTLGMTLTNFAQTLIAVFCAKPNFKFIVKYAAIVAALTITLMLVGNVFYPNASPYFFVPSSLLAEEENVYPLSSSRAVALVRAFAFNNFAAPTPLTSFKDIPFTQFRFYRPEDGLLGRYNTPLQSATEKVWIALLLLAAIFFVKDFKSQPRHLILALFGCLFVNLIIHLRYGKELFLYSANWTYAVTLLLGFSWKSLLKHPWFQITLVAFLILLMFNNAALLQTLMNVSAVHVH